MRVRIKRVLLSIRIHVTPRQSERPQGTKTVVPQPSGVTACTWGAIPGTALVSAPAHDTNLEPLFSLIRFPWRSSPTLDWIATGPPEFNDKPYAFRAMAI